MNFKDLENVEHGTVLVSEGGEERHFIGFSKHNSYDIVCENIVNRKLGVWGEDEIKNWKIKQPERKKITLYEAVDVCGAVCYVTEFGENPLFVSRMFNDNEEKYYRIIPNGRTIEIYADTFEFVEE